MGNEEKRVWGVHTQDDYLFLHNDVIAIGWKDFGDLKAVENTRDAFKEKYAQVIPIQRNRLLPTMSECSIALFMRCRSAIMSCSPPKQTA